MILKALAALAGKAHSLPLGRRCARERKAHSLPLGRRCARERKAHSLPLGGRCARERKAHSLPRTSSGAGQALCAVTIALAACAAAPPKEHIPDQAKGKELFQTCAGCHSYASDATKYGPSLRTLFGRVTLRSGKPANNANVRAIILDGYNRMPSFRYNFRPEEIDDLMAFLHTLNARPAEKAVTSTGEKYFRAYCLRCHEHNLTGVASHVSDARLHQFIDEGHAASPALKDWIDPDVRAALFEYVKRL